MLAASAAAQADSTILTFHRALDRAGRYVMPGLNYKRVRRLRLDPRSTRSIVGRSMRNRFSAASWAARLTGFTRPSGEAAATAA